MYRSRICDVKNRKESNFIGFNQKEEGNDLVGIGKDSKLPTHGCLVSSELSRLTWCATLCSISIGISSWTLRCSDIEQ
jgi:hypothetical protein